MLRYMLDTNICIFTIKNRPQEMREAFKRHHGQMCIVSPAGRETPPCS
ncbi:hypothetical protein SAMN05444352_10898 [Pseudomonas japonica]|uniref:PIN domain-containing protein n=1 Tax=Pseudomonas japonica TaxID=256466 RepID=A0A239ENY5_9PSED|nr:hypothetical protein SAMN05444352_10898 [Pseudomonas japonica]